MPFTNRYGNKLRYPPFASARKAYSYQVKLGGRTYDAFPGRVGMRRVVLLGVPQAVIFPPVTPPSLAAPHEAAPAVPEPAAAEAAGAVAPAVPEPAAAEAAGAVAPAVPEPAAAVKARARRTRHA